MIRVRTQSSAMVQTRVAGEHQAVVDLSGRGSKPRSGALCVCMDCGQTWPEGADVTEGYPASCSPNKNYKPPVARTEYMIRVRYESSVGGGLRKVNFRHWTGDGWDDSTENAVCFADWKSANKIVTSILQPFVFNTGGRMEIAPVIVT